MLEASGWSSRSPWIPRPTAALALIFFIAVDLLRLTIIACLSSMGGVVRVVRRRDGATNSHSVDETLPALA